MDQVNHHQSAAPAAAGMPSRPRVVVQMIPAGEGDTATRRTVELMCRYISDAVKDPRLIACADYAWRRFASSSTDPYMICWGVFWYVKHCVQFLQDEILLTATGLPGEQDALVSPSVLMRMKNPREDCDGFTMLTAALLTILGSSAVIVTVEVDPRRPGEFSHVFACAIPNGRAFPLDTSNGRGPGWMVPPAEVRRWQAWTLDGKPSDVKMPRSPQLHGYVRGGTHFGEFRRGAMGVGATPGIPAPRQMDWRSFFAALAAQGRGPGASFPVPPLSVPARTIPVDWRVPPLRAAPRVVPPARSGVGYYDAAGVWQPDESPFPVVMDGVPGSYPVPPASGSNWAGFIETLAQQGLNLTTKILTPPAYEQTITGPGGTSSTVVRAGGGPATAFSAAAGGLSSPNLLLWVGGGAALLMLAVSMAGGHRR